jgi:hypothetical protein
VVVAFEDLKRRPRGRLIYAYQTVLWHRKPCDWTCCRSNTCFQSRVRNSSFERRSTCSSQCYSSMEDIHLRPPRVAWQKQAGNGRSTSGITISRAAPVFRSRESLPSHGIEVDDCSCGTNRLVVYHWTAWESYFRHADHMDHILFVFGGEH